jgi:hypothetical protein
MMVVRFPYDKTGTKGGGQRHGDEYKFSAFHKIDIYILEHCRLFSFSLHRGFTGLLTKIDYFTKVRKLTAICLCCALILSQYGRFLAYVQCTISGFVSPGEPCDCEKQVPADYKADARDLPPPKGMNVAFEEFYLPVAPWAIQAPPVKQPATPYSRRSGYAFLHLADIFRPPRA